MKKAITLLAVLVVLGFLASCGATMPDGFDSAERGAYQAQEKADAENAQELVPMEYEAALSVLKTAESQKQAGEYESAMDLFQQAETKFLRTADQAQKKRELDEYMVDTGAYLERLEQKLDEK